MLYLIILFLGDCLNGNTLIPICQCLLGWCLVKSGSLGRNGYLPAVQMLMCGHVCMRYSMVSISSAIPSVHFWLIRNERQGLIQGRGSRDDLAFWGLNVEEWPFCSSPPHCRSVWPLSWDFTVSSFKDFTKTLWSGSFKPNSLSV